MNKKYQIKGVKQPASISQKLSVKQQEEIVYFRLRAPAEQNQPEHELIVNRFPRKKQKLNNNTQTEQHKSEQQKQKQKADEVKQVEDLFSQFNLKKSVQFFLKRVDDVCPTSAHHNQSQSGRFQEQMNQKSNTLSHNQRALIRQQLFAKSRGVELNTKKIKIIDFSEQYVELGNQKIAVQNLGSMRDYFYILSKRDTIKSGPTVTLPQNSTYLFDKIQFQHQISSEQQLPSQDEDSNRQSNPDYDYPEQDYHDGDSEDEGVIHKDYYPGCEDDEDDRNQSDYELDEEQVYRRYLRRCKNDRNKQSDDDQYY